MKEVVTRGCPEGGHIIFSEWQTVKAWNCWYVCLYRNFKNVGRRDWFILITKNSKKLYNFCLTFESTKTNIPPSFLFLISASTRTDTPWDATILKPNNSQATSKTASQNMCYIQICEWQVIDSIRDWHKKWRKKCFERIKNSSDFILAFGNGNFGQE